MLLIVAHHYVVNSGLTAADGPIYADPLSWKSLFLLLFGAWGKTGINCFVLITGYFMCTSHITAVKFAKLLGEVLFYRIITVLFWLFGYEAFSWKGLLQTIIPVSAVDLNFTNCYLFFYLCIPFLNILIQHLTKEQHSNLIALCCFIYVFFGTFHKVVMNYVSWFIVLYFIAAYLRLYPLKQQENTSLWRWMTMVSIVISASSVMVCAGLGTIVGIRNAYYFVADSNTFLAVVTSLCAFLYFKSVKIKQSKWINALASTTFGVLLIHAGSDTMRRWLWKDIFNCVGAYSSNFLVFHAIFSALIIFLVCALIDYLRILFIEKPYLQCVDNLIKKFL